MFDPYPLLCQPAPAQLRRHGDLNLEIWKMFQVEICRDIFFDSQFVSGGVPLFESLVEK